MFEYDRYDTVPAEVTVTGDPVSSDADILQDTDNNSVTGGDTDVMCDSGSHDVDDYLANQDLIPPYISTFTEWKPPPGWCWACWYKDP